MMLIRIVILTISLFLISPCYTAIFFDDINDIVIVSNTGQSTWMKSAKPMITIETWVWCTSTASDLGIFVFISASEIVFGIDTQKVRSYLAGTSEAWVIADTAMSIGTWHHIAMVYDGATRKHYLDGKLDNTPAPDTGSITAPTGDLQIGFYSGANRFGGRLAELRVWNYARSAEQIRHTMNRTLGGKEAGLENYYPFTERFNMPYDHSGNGNHATSITETTYVPHPPIKGVISD